MVVEGDNLETQPWQVAVVTATFAGHAAFTGNCFNEMLQINGGDLTLTSVESIALLISSWILADLGSGILHWSVDNYGNGKTPVMGGIIAAFQGHHAAPWTITERGFCNNVYKVRHKLRLFRDIRRILSNLFMFLALYSLWRGNHWLYKLH